MSTIIIAIYYKIAKEQRTMRGNTKSKRNNLGLKFWLEFLV
jgi:hypothetical protein